MATTFELEYGHTISLLLFTGVTNLKEITEKVTQNAPPFDTCIVINSQLILDPFQVLVAANKAVVSQQSSTLITKSVCTELLFNLSNTENITASLNKFGYHSSNENILLASFDTEPQKLENISSQVTGTGRSLSYLVNTRDLDLVKEAYDIADQHLLASSLLNLIVTKISCKGV